MLSGMTNGASIANVYQYNQRLQICRITASTTGLTPGDCVTPGNSGNLLDLKYDFHIGNGTAGSGTDNGNVWTITNYKDTNRTQTFTYDVLNRLASAQTAGTDCTKMTANGKTEYWGNSYGYDPWGNLGQKTVTKCSAENLGVSASVSNQLVGYNYDAAGNMISDPSDAVSVTYDPENRIASVIQGGVTTTYSYDGDGNRVKKATGGTGMLYWYGLPGALAESDLTGTIKSEYVFFNGTRVARRDEVTPAGVYYYFSDHIKSASLVTDAAGNVKSESDYYPWGGELAMSNSDPNHYKFTGKERDSESGLDYFGARFYSASMGRFMVPDWSEKPVTVPYAVLSDPQTLNLYSYVRNSPVARFDADGHFVTSAGSATAPACSDGTSSCMPNQSCSADVTTNCVNSSTTTVTVHGASNNNDEAVIDGTRKTVWTDSKGNQHTTVSTAEILVGGEGNWKAGVIDARGGSTTYDSSGKMESSSSFGRVDGAYYSATPQQIAAAVGVLGGTKTINQALVSANPDWVHNFGNAVAHDPHALVHAGAAITGGVCLITPCAAAVTAGAFLVESGNYLWEKLEK